MTAQHPEFAEEQAFIDHAYVCLEESRADALKMREFTTTGPGGTHQARFERNAVDEQLVGRLEKLDLGDSALVFGRIDRVVVDENDEPTDGIEGFHIGHTPVCPTVESASCAGLKRAERTATRRN